MGKQMAVLMETSRKFRVMSFGYNRMLLTIRALLLRNARYQVVNTCSQQTVLTQLESRVFQLLIICHTVPAEEQEFLIRAVHTHWPELRVVCLSPVPALSRPDRCMAASTAPEFLEDIRRVLPPLAA
jgi:DNA-binding NarL/FixJ family response regulator